MITARDIMTGDVSPTASAGTSSVSAEASVFDLLRALTESADGSVEVRRDGVLLGVVDSTALVRALGSMTSAADDCSVVVVECEPEDYSASLLAHAVEDADAHLVDMLTTSATEEGVMRVTLRVRMRNPESAVRSLERYGFRVVDARGIAEEEPSVLDERLAALQLFLNV